MSLRGDIDIVTALKVVTDAGEAAKEYDEFIKEVVSGSDDADDAIKKVGDESKKTREKGKVSFLGLSLSAASFAATMGLVGGIAGAAFSSMISASPALTGELILMRAEFNELFRVLGDQLQPIFEVINELLSDFTDWFKGLPQPIQAFIAVLITVIALLPVIIGLVIALTAVSWPLVAVILAIAAAIAFLAVAWENDWFGIRDLAIAVFDILKGAIGELRDVFVADWGEMGANLQTIWDAMEPIVTAMVSLFKTTFLLGVQNAVQGVVNKLNFFWDIFSGIIALVAAIIDGDWDAAWEALKDLALAPLEFLKSEIKRIFDFITGTLDAFSEFLADIFGEDNLLSKAISAISDLLTELGDMALDIIGFFEDLISSAFDWGADMILAFLEGVKSKVDALKDALVELGEEAKGWIGFSLPKKGPLKDTKKWGEHMADQFLIQGFAKEASSILGTGSPISPIASALPMAMPGGNSNITNSRSNQNSSSVNMPITIRIDNFSGDRRDLDRLAAEVARRIQNRVFLRVKGT